jgi:16S rRNA C967 or C1407 C5-methylase (RsmB/RsmF family)/NOL1/NOP2/fmu family ribosome biogenesis protein
MKLPEEFLQSLESVAGFEKEAFIRVHDEALPPTSVRINPAKALLINGAWTIASDPLFAIQPSQQIPWTQYGYYLARRPSFTFDPFFHAGCYYVQEASSMFLEQALSQLLDLSKPLKVLDLCAAPGGKSTHIQSLISPESLVVSNEVIKTRSIVLTDNIIRWGCSNVFVSNNDPRAFQKLPGYFDVMVVDAPCSGSGLFRKDEDAVEEWSLNNVALCSQRQQRILADVLPALKEDGLLVYSTCSYSKEEDEAIMDWLTGEMEMENVALRTETITGIVVTESPKHNAVGYRFYPDKIRGEGFFLCCFRKKSNDSITKLRPGKPELITAREKKIVEEWITTPGLSYVRFRNEISAVPQQFLSEFSILQPLLNLHYIGVAIGEVLKERLVPAHALAQSTIVSDDIPATSLPYDDAIKYLQRQEINIQPRTTGWQVVRYGDRNLGWINALKNRVNNYYPKEIRILKAHNDISFEK